MRKILLFLLISSLAISSNALTTPASKQPLKATEVYLPIGQNGELVSLYELTVMSPRDMQKLTGKKLGFFKRMEFRIAQNKLRQAINKDGTFSDKRMKRYYNRMIDGTTGFHLGGFILGLILGPIGAIIALFINDEKKPNRLKWSLIGLIVWLIIGGSFVL
jgi:hypothetical protein